MEEYQYSPIGALESMVAEKSMGIYKVAVSSGNLKGTLVKHTKESAADLCAAATVLAMKAQNPEEETIDSQLRELRQQMRALRVENEHLRKTVTQLKKKMQKGQDTTSRDEASREEGSLDEGESEHIPRLTRQQTAKLPPFGKKQRKDTRIEENPLPLESVEAPQACQMEARGAPLPPTSGGFSPIHRTEDIEVMEIEEEETSIFREETSIFRKEEFPPLTTKRNERRKWEIPKKMDTVEMQSKIPVPLNPRATEHGEKEERRKMENLIAMIEGVVVREMDKRLGDPIPTFHQKKEEERAKRKEEERVKRKEQDRKGKEGVRKSSSAVVKSPQEGKTEGEKAVKAKSKPVIKSITTLNPPARLAKERIKTPKTLVPQEDTSQQRPHLPNQQQKWTEVIGKKSKAVQKQKQTPQIEDKKGKGKESERTKKSSPPAENRNIKPRLDPKPPSQKRRREPRMAAITVTCPPGQYERVMREARQKIDLEDLGILEGVKIRRAITGALMYEIPGEKSQEKADRFARKLRTVLASKEGVTVQRPMKSAEVRIRGLDDSITPADIRNVVATDGKCEWEEVKVGDIKKAPNGMGIVWVRCPLAAANTLANKGQLKIGWARARVELLETRPLQCFKCLEGGHVRARCPNKEDRSNICYRCGQEGHAAKNCEAPAHCAICASKNLPANHRMGGKACVPVQKGKRGFPLDKLTKPREELTSWAEEPPKEQRAPSNIKKAAPRRKTSDAMEIASENEEETTVRDGLQ